MNPRREPGYAAVRVLIRSAGTDVYTNALIWRCVEAFGDAMDVPNNQEPGGLQ